MTINAKTAIPNQVDAQGMTVLEQQKNRKYNTIDSADSQPERLLAALQYGPVTTTAAIYGMHIPHPACAVHRLRLQGHNISTELRPTDFPDGAPRWCAEYRLVGAMEG